MTQAFDDPPEAHLDGVGGVTPVHAYQLAGFERFPFELAKLLRHYFDQRGV
jgi:hypothetical protein